MVLRLKVEEWPHAYLVIGTNDYNIGRRALIKKFGAAKAAKINRMPCRPMWGGEIGRPDEPHMVAFYFNIGARCECEEECDYCSTHRKDQYKP